jgi:hypothetical protein
VKEKGRAGLECCTLLAMSVHFSMYPTASESYKDVCCFDCTPRSAKLVHHLLSEVTFASPAICEYPRHIPQLLLYELSPKCVWLVEHDGE